jgi:hypothetical protein
LEQALRRHDVGRLPQVNTQGRWYHTSWPKPSAGFWTGDGNRFITDSKDFGHGLIGKMVSGGRKRFSAVLMGMVIFALRA